MSASIFVPQESAFLTHLFDPDRARCSSLRCPSWISPGRPRLGLRALLDERQLIQPHEAPSTLGDSGCWAHFLGDGTGRLESVNGRRKGDSDVGVWFGGRKTRLFTGDC